MKNKNRPRPTFLDKFTMRHIPFLIFLSATILAGQAPATALATDIIVNSTDDLAVNLDDSVVTLRDAIAAADGDLQVSPGGPTGASEDRILFDPALAGNTIVLTSSLPDITSIDGLIIDGQDRDIVLDGNGSVRHIAVFANARLELYNLAVANGVGAGGAIRTFHCSTLVIGNSTFRDNRGNAYGGAILADSDLVVSGSTFTGNFATELGGAIAHTAPRSGSSLHDGPCGLFTVSNSTFSGNSAGEGGAIARTNNSQNTDTITNSTFTGNSTENGGAILIIPPATITLTNTIVANNTASNGTLHNCSDYFGLGPSPWIVDGGNNIADPSDDCGFVGGVNGSIVDDPLLAPLTDNGGPTFTHALLPGSPAIDAGDNTVCANTPVDGLDQRGLVRPKGAACDIGAFEALQVNTASVPAATGTGSITASISGGGPTCSITELAATTPAAVAGEGPPGIAFPDGLVDLRLDDCEPGSAVTLTLTFPAALPAGTQYFKYGPTPDNAAPDWYVLPTTFADNVVTYSITDGGLGDDDLAANGVIDDPGGPGSAEVGEAAGAVPIPVMPRWMLAVLASLMLVTAWGAGPPASRLR